MGSFSCPHVDSGKGRCLRLKTDCVPGRPGCVLGGKSGFAFPLEERLANHRKGNSLQQAKPHGSLIRGKFQPRTPNR